MSKKDEESTVVMDQRKCSDRRKSDDRRQQDVAVPVERRAGPRREKVSRRRQIDPTTCERDYSEDEVQFMNALDEYKRRSGRMFPTCSEILEVIRALGYSKPGQQSGPSAEPFVGVAETTTDAPAMTACPSA